MGSGRRQRQRIDTLGVVGMMDAGTADANADADAGGQRR